MKLRDILSEIKMLNPKRIALEMLAEWEDTIEESIDDYSSIEEEDREDMEVSEYVINDINMAAGGMDDFFESRNIDPDGGEANVIIEEFCELINQKFNS